MFDMISANLGGGCTATSPVTFHFLCVRSAKMAQSAASPAKVKAPVATKTAPQVVRTRLVTRDSLALSTPSARRVALHLLELAEKVRFRDDADVWYVVNRSGVVVCMQYFCRIHGWTTLPEPMYWAQGNRFASFQQGGCLA